VLPRLPYLQEVESYTATTINLMRPLNLKGIKMTTRPA
jgi:hypothetical protein